MTRFELCWAILTLFTLPFSRGMVTDYAVVVDGGSTGSRGYVFKFYEENGQDKIHVTKGKKIMPGISTFADTPEEAGPYLLPLLQHAAEIIPVEYMARTHIFVLGTAGMRLLSQHQQDAIWDAIAADSGIQSLPFTVPRSNMWTINGKLEAYYAVLAANFIAGRIDTSLIPKGEGIMGALDMGGSSSQMVFHTGSEAGQPLQPDHFWSHSWLSFGSDKVQERVWELLLIKYQKQKKSDAAAGIVRLNDESVRNPCIFKRYKGDFTYTGPVVEGTLGAELGVDGSPVTVTMEGSGMPSDCRELVREVLWPQGCPDVEGQACPIDNIEHPPVDGLFFGMSVYFFALDCVRHLGHAELPNWPNSSIDELEHAAMAFCEMKWEEVSKLHQENGHPQTRDEKLPARCVEALYITTLLEDGFGFRGSHRGITLVLEIEGTEVEWTLGFALAEECRLSRQKANTAAQFVDALSTSSPSSSPVPLSSLSPSSTSSSCSDMGVHAESEKYSTLDESLFESTATPVSSRGSLAVARRMLDGFCENISGAVRRVVVKPVRQLLEIMHRLWQRVKNVVLSVTQKIHLPKLPKWNSSAAGKGNKSGSESAGVLAT